MEFYSVKHRKKVDVADADVSRQVVERTTKDGGVQKRYMLVAKTKVDGDAVTMTKFVNEATYNAFKG